MAESFNPQGLSQWVFVDKADLAAPATPTAAELAEGIVLGDATLSLKSPSVKANTIDATPITADTTETINALAGIESAELTIRSGDKSTALSYALFNTMKGKEGDEGYLVNVLRGKADGLIAGGVCDVYPATINTVGRNNSAPGAPASWLLTFSHSGQFHENRLIVAG